MLTADPARLSYGAIQPKTVMAPPAFGSGLQFLLERLSE
jgi:hypothetical protein